MYVTKSLDFGFVILSPDIHYGRIKCTHRSIMNNYGDVPIICVVTDDAKRKDLQEIRKMCPVHKGGKYYTSLINCGMEKGHKEWNLFVVEDTIVSRNIHYKYSRFIENEYDVLFAISPDYDIHGKPVKLNCEFYNSSLNGLFINKKVYDQVGKFSDNPLEISRATWAYDAVLKGCRFKGILGVKLT